MTENGDSQKPLSITEHIGCLDAHGIPNIERAKNNYRRCFWLLLCLGGLTAFSFHCYFSVLEYLQHEVTVNLDLRYTSHILFPAITICNLNSVKQSALRKFTDLDDLLGSGVGSGTPNMEMTQQNRTTTTKKRYQDWNNIDFDRMETENSLTDTVSDTIGKMDYKKRFFTGHDLSDMLLSCSFAGFPCAPTNFTWFYNYLYGNCYTFNSGSNPKTLQTSTAGHLYGLTISMYIEQDEYSSDIQQGAGIRVAVHSPNTMPFPENEGVNVATGTEGFISIHKTRLERKSSPYTNCTATKKDTIFSETFSHVAYTKLTCEKDCYFKTLLERCECADYKYRYDNSTVPCNGSDPKQEKCVTLVENQFVSVGLNCNCTFACQEDEFKLTVSHSLWPNDKYKATVEDGIRDISDTLKRRINDDTEFVEKNVVKVNVFYDQLTYTYIYQTATYGNSALLSNLGGNAGLWIGISVLTIFEVIELLYDILLLLVIKAKSTGEKSAGQLDREASDIKMNKIEPATNPTPSAINMK